MKRPANVEQWQHPWTDRSRGWYFQCADCGSPGGRSHWRYRLTWPKVNREGLAICGDCNPLSAPAPRFWFCLKCGDAVPDGDMAFGDGSFGSIRYPHHKSCPAGWNPGPDTCEQCGASLTRPTSFGPMKPGRADRRYCSTRCRVAAHRARVRVTASGSS